MCGQEQMDDPEPKREGGRAARRASATHQKLLHAALSTFTTHGFEGCAIEDITERADVGKGTFYRHFHDKHAVLVELLQSAVQLIEGRITTIHPRPGNLSDAIGTFFKAYAWAFRERVELFVLLTQTQSMMATRGVLYPDVEPLFQRLWGILDQFLAQYLPPSMPTETRQTYIVMLCGLMSGALVAGIPGMSAAIAIEKAEALGEAMAPAIAEHLRCTV